MADKIIDIVRKAIESLQRRRDVVAGYGIDRKTHRSRGVNIYDRSERYNRYWVTVSSSDNGHRDLNESDIIINRNTFLATRIQEHKVGDEFEMIIRGAHNDVGCLWHHNMHMLHHIDLENRYVEYPGEKFPYNTLESYLQYLQGVANDLEIKEARRRQIEEEKKIAKTEQVRKAIEQLNQ